jgi:hypothetical protein
MEVISIFALCAALVQSLINKTKVKDINNQLDVSRNIANKRAVEAANLKNQIDKLEQAMQNRRSEHSEIYTKITELYKNQLAMENRVLELASKIPVKKKTTKKKVAKKATKKVSKRTTKKKAK